MSPEEDWQPPPGMFKRRCASCERYFAGTRYATTCPTCAKGGRSVDVGPFDTSAGGKGTGVTRTHRMKSHQGRR